jgi:hypothetical protein
MAHSSAEDRKDLIKAFGLTAEDEAYFAELDERAAQLARDLEIQPAPEILERRQVSDVSTPRKTPDPEKIEDTLRKMGFRRL